MATQKPQKVGAPAVPDEEEFKPGYNSVDRKGTWFRSNAVFPLEDTSNVGKGPLTRFEPGSYTQATETNWTKGQHEKGVLTKYDGDPRDEDTKEVAYVETNKPSVPTPEDVEKAKQTLEAHNRAKATGGSQKP